MNKFIALCYFVLCMPALLKAQETRVIEPAILECRYDAFQKGGEDSYILRTGRNTSQFFSFYRFRQDSMLNYSEATKKIITDEMLEDLSGKKTPNSRKGGGTISHEWLYMDKKEGKLSLYSNYSEARNCYEEDIPEQAWTIDEDTTRTILGMECHHATTTFRGRTWKVWFTEEIPIGLGPWKLNGLPGLILDATTDDDFIRFTAVSVKAEEITPVTFYNWENEGHYKMTREKFLKYKNRPRTIPYANKVLPAEPYIELD